MPKAQLLGDNGNDEEEGFDPFRRRVTRLSMGGALGRVARPAPVGVAAASLGGPQPTRGTLVFGGGARQLILEDRMERN